MSCIIGINNTIKKIIDNKPWFSFNERAGIVRLLPSPTYKLNPKSIPAATRMFVEQVNKKFNSFYNGLGDILYFEYYKGAPIAQIIVTERQANLINEIEDDRERAEIEADYEREMHLKSAERKRLEAAELIDEDGNVLFNQVQEEDYPEENSSLENTLDIRNNLSITEVNLLAGRIARYNKKNNTSHHFIATKQGESGFYTIDFKVNYLPKKVAVQQQTLFDKREDWKAPNSDILNNNARGLEKDLNYSNSDENSYDEPTRDDIDDCLTGFKAKDGMKTTKFTKGSEWEVVSDLGAPSFTKGGEWRLEGAATHNTLGSASPKIKAEKGIVISKFKPTKAKENSTSIYNAIPTAIDFDINSNNVDNIIADARRRKDVSLYDGNSYKTDYGQDENGEYISFYRKDGNTLTDLFGTSKEYYDRRYIEPRDILKLKTEGVTINDNRRINNLTGAPLKNNKKGVYGYPIIEQIIKAANKYEIDPYVAISMALQETNLGKTGAGVENPFHMNGGIKETPENLKRYAEYFKNMKKDKGDIIDRAMNMMKNVSYKDMPKNPGNYSDEIWRIQSHNGWGYITPNTEIEYDGGGDRYEMKIPKEGVSMKKNPIYGRFIKQLKDESIATNKDIQRLVEYFSKNSSK